MSVKAIKSFSCLCVCRCFSLRRMEDLWICENKEDVLRIPSLQRRLSWMFKHVTTATAVTDSGYSLCLGVFCSKWFLLYWLQESWQFLHRWRKVIFIQVSGFCLLWWISQAGAELLLWTAAFSLQTMWHVCNMLLLQKVSEVNPLSLKANRLMSYRTPSHNGGVSV